MNGGSDMTLAFELEALKEVASPENVFEDAEAGPNTSVSSQRNRPTS